MHDVERCFGCAVSKMAIRVHRQEKMDGRIDNTGGRIVEAVLDAVYSSKCLSLSAQKLALRQEQ